jgi:membrane fusion protein (multidrug efflux system)
MVDVLPGALRRSAQAACAVLLALTLAACDRGDAKTRPDAAGGPPEVGYVVLATESVPLTVELAGRTAAYEASEVRPQVSGVIVARSFTEGSVVREGQTLYQIDAATYRATETQAAAQLESARAARDAAVAKAGRAEQLVGTGLISQQDYADTVATAAQASAEVDRARGALEQARINLRYTKVPAPIGGRIGRSLATTGALVTQGQAEALAVIQRLDPIFVDIQQSSSDLLTLRRALASGGLERSTAAVHLTLEDGSTYPIVGQMQFAESLVDPNTGAVTLRAKFANPDGLLLPGMYVRATISQAMAQGAILVPQPAVTRDAKGNATAFVVAADGKAEPRQLVADRTVGDRWLVTDGLHAGDRLIVEGLGRVKPGQPVRAVPL